ncbi:tetratricopeptide repeat-containing sensor histidine kinase [Flavobacterium granuli]|uniref:histidine kinase n=1 Tax=Flavobacterium granuli TaxID=280093 RepID=A0ABU1S4K8_9FLAO|nr:tetratricopeptide repeat-containing sensor histidine kinase [Flavobacterium granuli]MDR6845950.1 signal transduction histidine kinase [Flavobacterium granuli]
MKKRFLLLLLFCCCHTFWAQNEIIDSLKKRLKTIKDDKERVMVLKDLSYELSNYDPDKAFKYASEEIELSRKIDYDLGLGYGYQSLGFCYSMMSNNVRALEYFDKADSIFSELKDKKGICVSEFGIGNLFSRMGNNVEAIACYKKALKIAKSEAFEIMISRIWNQMSMAYRRNGQLAEAMNYAKLSLELDTKLKNNIGIATSLVNLGIGSYNLKRYAESQEFFKKALAILKDDQNYIRALAESHSGSGLFLMASEMPDGSAKRAYLNQAVSHFRQGIAIFGKLNNLGFKRKSYIELYKVAKALNDPILADECSFNAFMLGNKILANQKEEFVLSLKRERSARMDKLVSDKKSRLLGYGSALILFVILLQIMYVRRLSYQKRMNIALEEKKTEIEKLNIQKDQFYSIIAHDLRGSLGGFHALTEFLAEEGNSMDKEQIMESVVIMRDSANGLFSLLEGLLDWSKSEKGLVEFNPQVIELSQAIGQAIGVLSENAYKKNIEIFADVKEDLTVYADDNLLQTVLRNLISNAIKFTPRGGKVDVITQIDTKQNVEIQISDTGIGMNEQMVKDLFNSEIKSNRLGTDNEPSTGLGIVLCKEFVERHGGKIWVESKVGEGTIFRFNIPAKQLVS